MASLLALGLLSAGGLAVGASAARAAESGSGAAPVTSPDKITLTQGEGIDVDVLKNDTDADGDRLEVCRLGKIPKQLLVEKTLDGSDGVHVVTSSSTTQAPNDSATQSSTGRGGRGQADTQLIVVATGKPGVYTVTYYACDYSYLTAGTLTVEVKEAPQIKVKVTKLDNRPGRLRVTNTSGFPVRFMWGAFTGEKADGTVTVTRKPVIITVNRPSIFWAAVNRNTTDLALGATRHIRLPAGTKHLPPGAPDQPIGDLGFKQTHPTLIDAARRLGHTK